MKQWSGTVQNFFANRPISRQGYYYAKSRYELPLITSIRQIVQALGLSKKQICDLLIEKE